MVRIEADGLAKLVAGRLHVAFEAESESEIVVVLGIVGFSSTAFADSPPRTRPITPVRHDLTQREIDCRLPGLELAGGF